MIKDNKALLVAVLLITFGLIGVYGFSSHILLNLLWLFTLISLLASCQRIIAFLGFLFLSVICFFEVFVVFKYKDLNTGILEAIWTTNISEAEHMLKANGILCITTILFCVFMSYLLSRGCSFSLRKFVVKGMVFVVVTIISIRNLFFLETPLLREGVVGADQLLVNTAQERAYRVIQEKKPIVLGNVLYSYFFLKKQYYLAHLDEFVFLTDQTKEKPPYVIDFQKKNRIKNVIIVMGESSSSHFYSIYGHSIPTTPKMQILAKRGLLDVCTKVHSPANITRTSVPLNLSFASPRQFNDLYKYKSIINLAKDAGYRTFWLATQNSGGFTGWGSTYEYISRSADVLVTPDIEHPKLGRTSEDDELMPPLLSMALDDYKTEYNFIVIHLVGSHAPYKHRFSEEDSSTLRKGNEYEKSIHKTDRVVSKLIEILEQKVKDYVLLYTSDHGEIVEDEGAGVEHGLTYGGPVQYEIPFVIVSPNGSLNCELLNSFRYKNGFFSGLSTKLVVLKLLGYRMSEEFLLDYLSTDEVLHSDGKVYEYSQLPTVKDRL